MQIVEEPDWPNRFILTAHALTGGERNELARMASGGRLRRVSRGVYVPTGAEPRTGEGRHRDLVHARHLTSRTPLTFSHASAGALWRIPRVARYPDRVDVLTVASTGRTTPHQTRRAGTVVDPDVIDGVRVTPLARTVVDLARVVSFADAVVAVDAALAGVPLRCRVTRDELLAELDRIGVAPGSRRATTAVAFADAGAGSAGETDSRISIARSGLSAPTLQRVFVDELGRMYTDFWWEEWGVVGEFDGEGKYLREELMEGRTTAEVVIAEKKREDRLRRQAGVTTVVRWGWDVARSPLQLGALLRQAGVR